MRIKIENPNSPITENEIDLFEKEFNIKLPKPYKLLLLENNLGSCDVGIP